MSQTSTLRRFPGLLLAVGSIVLVAGAAQGGTVGLAVTKTCPNTAVQGDKVTCTITVQNNDPAHGVSNLSVTNQVPFPGGAIGAVGTCAGSLAANGLMGDTTSCDVDETLDQCSGVSTDIADKAVATGLDGGTPVEGSITNSITVTCSTPTPTNTPADTATPTDTPTVTPTPTVTDTPANTPTPTNTQPVHVTGLDVEKTCPNSANQGDTIQCTIKIQNLGQSGVSSLAVTNQVPFPGGPIANVSDCASSLSAKGTPGDTTSCTVQETLNEPCPAGTSRVVDRVMVTGQDTDIPSLEVQGSGSNSVNVTCRGAAPAVGPTGLAITALFLVVVGAWYSRRSAMMRR